MPGEVGTARLIRETIARLSVEAPPLTLERRATEVGLSVERLIKLDQNENPYGPSLRVQEALAAFERYHLYPDPEGGAVRERLGAYVGLPCERILLGSDLEELLDLICLLAIDPGDEVIIATPAIDSYRVRAEVHGARVIEVSRRPDFGLDVDALVRAITPRTKLIVVGSPNDPTGNCASREQIVRLLRLGIFVVLDESYAEFAERSILSLAREFDNLIVLRSLSIWAGLAGLRIGYGVFPGDLMPHLWKIKPAFNVNVAALVAAEASFDDFAWLRSTVVRLRVERGRLYRKLRKLIILQPLPSEGNFLLCRVIHGRGEEVRARLADYGLLVRGYHGALAGYVRISVGRPEDTDVLMKALLTITERF